MIEAFFGTRLIVRLGAEKMASLDMVEISTKTSDEAGGPREGPQLKETCCGTEATTVRTVEGSTKAMGPARAR